MYELYQLDNDLYQIHSSFYGERAMEGTLLAILTYAVHTLHFNPEELELALTEMIWMEHNAAQFGINRCFIFTFDKAVKQSKVG